MDPPSGHIHSRVKASKYTGVFRAGKKWKSQAQCQGVQHYLGIFSTEEEAHEAYLRYKNNQDSYKNDVELRMKLKEAKQDAKKSEKASSSRSSNTAATPPPPLLLTTSTVSSASLSYSTAYETGMHYPTPYAHAPLRHGLTMPQPLPRISQLYQTTPLRVQSELSGGDASADVTEEFVSGGDITTQSVTIELPIERMRELRLKLSLGHLLAPTAATHRHRELGYTCDSLNSHNPMINSADQQTFSLMKDILEAMGA